MIGQSHDEETNGQTIIDIYGPEGELVLLLSTSFPAGTRAYVRAITQLTHSYIAAPHRIHELKAFKGKSTVEPVALQRNRCGERSGSTDIYPQPDGRSVSLSVLLILKTIAIVWLMRPQQITIISKYELLQFDTRSLVLDM